MAEAEVPADSIEAWALPPRERAQRRTDFSGQTVVVVARVDQRYYAVRSRLPPEGVRLQGFLLWQTLSLYLLLLIPILFIAWPIGRASCRVSVWTDVWI